MKEIGKLIQETRIEQNKSIEDISNITKMNTNIIRNIELGNVDYFNNDFSYLRYYVRAYLATLNLEVENLESRLTEATLAYTQSINTLEKEKIDQINEHIKTKKISISSVNQNKSRVRKVDWTLVSLISVVVLISLFLVYSVTTSILNKPVENDTPPPVVLPEEKDPDDKEDENVIEEKPEEEIKVKVEMLENNHLEINDWDNDLKIISKFNVPTWVQIMVNNQIVSIPDSDASSMTYQANDEMIITNTYKLNAQELEFKEGDVISIRYGIMNGNEFLINDEIIDLDPSVKNATGGTDLKYTIGKKAE